MSENEPRPTSAGIPLKAHVEELRSRCEAVSRLQGGSTYLYEEVGIFLDYIGECGLILDTAPEELSRPPDDEGNEHQVWFLPEEAAVLKASWPDFFGLLVIHRPGEEPRASPIDYLQRWMFHNELFGDDITFLGAMQTGSGLRLLIRQPAVAGEPATDEQIAQFFLSTGWKRFSIDSDIAFFAPDQGIAISDTHRGNIILMEDGLLAPIDLRIQLLTGSLIDSVSKLCQN
jgi:hypothetical protein